MSLPVSNGSMPIDAINNPQFPVLTKEEVLKKALFGPSEITSEEISVLHKFYPKLTQTNGSSRHWDLYRKGWTPATGDPLFNAACEYQHEPLVQDIIKICGREKSFELLCLNKYKLGDFLRNFSDETVFLLINTLIEIDSERFFSLEILSYDSWDINHFVHVLVSDGSLNALKKFLQMGDPKKLLLLKNASGETPLHVSIKYCKAEKIDFITEELIRLDCIQNLIDEDKLECNPLHYGFGSTDRKLLNSFTKLVRTIREEIGAYPLRKRNKYGDTPLTNTNYPHDRDRSQIIERARLFIHDFTAHQEADALLEKGANDIPPFFKYPELLLQQFISSNNFPALSATDIQGNNFLHHIFCAYYENKAEKQAHIDLFIEFCLNKGQKELLWAQNHEGKTPLDRCDYPYSTQLLEIYKKHYPQALTLKHSNGGSPLDIAVSKGWIEAIEAILSLYRQSGEIFRILEKNDLGESALMICKGESITHLFLKELLGLDNTLEITWELYKNAPKHVELIKQLLFSKSIRVEPWGKHDHTGAHFARTLMNEERCTHIALKSKIAIELATATAPVFKSLKELPFPQEDEVEKVYSLGRTLVFLPKDKGKLCDAFKFAWKDETETQLGLEYTVTKIFAESQMMASKMPEPMDCYSTENVPEAYLALLKDRSEKFPDGNFRVYHYRAPESYFRYLHETLDACTESQYFESLTPCIKDRVMQLKNGILPVTANIWHNVGNKLSYIPLSDLMAVTRNGPEGMGRISLGFFNIEHANERFSGGADWVDFSLISEAVGKNVRDIESSHTSKISSLQLNDISKFYLTHTLIAIYRLFKEGEISWADNKKCKKLGDYLKTVFVKIFANYTHEEESAAMMFAEAGDIDWLNMAREISFWVDNSKETGYYVWVYEGKLPEVLYQGITHSVMKGKKYENVKRSRHSDQFFRPNTGFCEYKDHHDFGCFAGPLGWVAFELALYKFSVFTYNIAEYKTRDVATI